MKINLIGEKKPKRYFKKSPRILTLVALNKIWNPWSPEALLYSFESKIRDVSRGPGELRLKYEPTAPTYGGIIQGQSEHFDNLNPITRQQYEIKGLCGSGRDVNIAGEGDPYVTKFTTQMGLVVSQIEEFKRALDVLDPQSAQFIVRDGFSIRRFNEYYEEIFPNLATTELARGTIEHSADQFEKIARVMMRFSNSLVNWKTGIGGVIFECGDRTDYIAKPSLELQIRLLKESGTSSPREIGQSFFAMAGQEITHPWLIQYGALMDNWKNLVKASDVLKGATDGLVIAHEFYGWFHLTPDEFDTWLTLDAMTRGSLRFRLNMLPPKPIQFQKVKKSKVVLRCVDGLMEC